MAFNLQGWGRISGGGGNEVVTLADGTLVGSPQYLAYNSAGDTAATICAADYFNDVAGQLNVNDRIYVVASDTNVDVTVTAVTVGPTASVTTSTSGGAGDVDGPASSTDNAVARFDSTTGKLLQDSSVLISDADAVTGVTALTTAALTVTDVTASRAVVTDGSSALNESATTAAELAYVNGVTSAIQTQLDDKISQDGAQVFAADAEASDTYVITLSPVPSGYTTGMRISFSANTVNTGAATINVNTLGAKAILKNHDVVLADGDIEAGQLVDLIYDGTQFQMQSQLGNTAASTSDFVLLATGTASASASLDFTSSIDSTYIAYVFVLDRIAPATDNVDLYLRVSDDAGVSFEAGAADYEYSIQSQAFNGAGFAGAVSQGATHVLLSSTPLGNDTNEFMSGQVEVYSPSTGNTVGMTQSHILRNNSGTGYSATGVGLFNGNTNAVDGVQFIMSSGNIASGTVRMYGIKAA